MLKLCDFIKIAIIYKKNKRAHKLYNLLKMTSDYNVIAIVTLKYYLNNDLSYYLELLMIYVPTKIIKK